MDPFMEDFLMAWLYTCRFGQHRQMLEEDPRRKWRYWVHPYSRRGQGKVISETYTMTCASTLTSSSYFWISIPTFDFLLLDLRPGITFQDTNMRRCITAEERLIVTLRFLATGNSFVSLHFGFLLADSTTSLLVRHTCQVIWQRLKPTVMPDPKCEDWLRIANGFQKVAHFLNSVGDLDGKHIQVKKPAYSGSLLMRHGTRNLIQ
ncbi:uncharacterized protein RB166_014514 [Leptodactylus fuscus]|uniref:uncharacterized protein LOC142190442 n=1 Tax=Leptodactylus fuscus TaxID=238119 RepID=UPI003F4F2588